MGAWVWIQCIFMLLFVKAGSQSEVSLLRRDHFAVLVFFFFRHSLPLTPRLIPQSRMVDQQAWKMSLQLFSNAGITSVCHHTQPFAWMLRVKFRRSFFVDFTDLAIVPAFPTPPHPNPTHKELSLALGNCLRLQDVTENQTKRERKNKGRSFSGQSSTSHYKRELCLSNIDAVGSGDGTETLQVLRQAQNPQFSCPQPSSSTVLLAHDFVGCIRFF